MSTPISSSSGASSPSTVISSQGVGVGLDIAAIVTSLTTAKAAPLTNAINRSNTALNAQVSAFGTFNSAVATFQATLTALQNPAQLAGRTAALADATIATATATAGAVTGQYSIAVQNLATPASLSSAPNLGGATAVIGTGTLQISVGGVLDSIAIDSTDNTLQGIAAAINSAPGNPGVTASILTTSDGARLVLTGTKTGATNGILVTQSGGDGGLASLVYDPANNLTTLAQTQAALDANFTVNGYAATSASNQVTSVISGVTLNLLKASTAIAGTPPTYTPTNPDHRQRHGRRPDLDRHVRKRTQRPAEQHSEPRELRSDHSNGGPAARERGRPVVPKSVVQNSRAGQCRHNQRSEFPRCDRHRRQCARYLQQQFGDARQCLDGKIWTRSASC